jgi:hypothetical protein
MVTKWEKVIAYVMKARCSSHVKNKLACKDNWGAVNDDFKLIYDYMDKIDRNEKYWLMSPRDRTTLHYCLSSVKKCMTC